ncbi:TPA: hypothetical protein SMF84_000224 [Serratia marcescens]|uniref:hypothetical protein n=1 Tax=Serratia TaxID=613 RepID=UPI001ECBB273|nr:hypothetical protein [Serratia marcescens]EGT0451670.1 hypothetical protein [Serratia marcescens]MCM2650984.1 hypothetical protein [Serratia marcescens]HEJ7137410.1 hypothetical protein [Serratia marcescens]HEJ7181312.1 hypothetical protein [Serratia marcescens]HEJ7210874.1 hypothetical protein [Serratia marcescens]
MSDKNCDMVDFDAFANYLNTLKGEQVCPICHEEQWKLHTPSEVTEADESKALVLPTLPGTFLPVEGKAKAGFFRSRSLDLLMMQCQNCGFMHLFNYKTVEKNIKEKNYVKQDKVDGDETSGG